MTSPMTDRELELLAGNSFATNVTYLPVSETGRLAISANAYDTVVSWTIPAGSVGILKEISFVTDEVGVTQYQLTIGGVVKWTDRTFQSSNLTIPFPNTPLLELTVVLLEAQSDGTVTATIDGAISGEERS